MKRQTLRKGGTQSRGSKTVQVMIARLPKSFLLRSDTGPCLDDVPGAFFVFPATAIHPEFENLTVHTEVSP